MAADGVTFPKIALKPDTSEQKSILTSRSSPKQWNSSSLEDSGVSMLEPKLSSSLLMERHPLRTSGESSLKENRIHEDRFPVTSPIPPPQSLRKSTDVVRMTKADLERKETTIANLQKENAKLHSQLRHLELTVSTLEEIKDCFSEVGGAVGVSPGSVLSKAVRQVVLDKVKTLVKNSTDIASEVASVNDKMEDLLGEIAEEKERADNVTSELESCRSLLKQTVEDFEHTKANNERMKQTLARTTAQLESNRKRLKDLEVKQSKAPPEFDRSYLEEVGKLKQQLHELELGTQELRDACTMKDATVQSLQQQLTSSQDLVSEFLDQVSNELHLSGEDAGTNQCLQQIIILKKDNENLTKCLKTLDEQKQGAEASAKANRETILRLVSEAKQHEVTLAKLAKLEQERDLAFASKVSAEHDREELSYQLERTSDKLKRMEETSSLQTEQLDIVQRELQQSQAEQREREQQFAEFVSGIEQLTGCESSNVGEGIIKMKKEKEELDTIKERMGRMESALRASQESVQQLSSNLAQQEDEVKAKDEAMAVLQQELDTCHSQITALETSLGHFHQQEDQRDLFYRRLAKVMKMDEATVDMLSGEFAVDAILARAEQLALRETRDVSEKQASIYKLQRKLKSTKQALDSKELLVTLIQKKVEKLEERLLSYSRPHTHHGERKV